MSISGNSHVQLTTTRQTLQAQRAFKVQQKRVCQPQSSCSCTCSNCPDSAQNTLVHNLLTCLCFADCTDTVYSRRTYRNEMIVFLAVDTKYSATQAITKHSPWPFENAIRFCCIWILVPSFSSLFIHESFFLAIHFSSSVFRYFLGTDSALM